MSSSMTVEEKFEAVIKQMHEMFIANQELKAQNEYLRKQLGWYETKTKASRC